MKLSHGDTKDNVKFAKKSFIKTLLSFMTSSLIFMKGNLSLNQMKMIGWMKMRNNYNAQQECNFSKNKWHFYIIRFYTI